MEMYRATNPPPSRQARARIGAVLRDPFLAASLGICALLAASPLAWFHYYVLLLAPALRMVATPSSSGAVKALAGASMILASGAAGWLPALEPAVPYMVAVSWAPLWTATLQGANGGKLSEAIGCGTLRSGQIDARAGARFATILFTIG